MERGSIGGMVRGWARACCAALLCLAATVCVSERSSFRDYTEGLRNFNINAIGQDQSGYLWVGTENGLYRYDGVHFRPYGAQEGLNSSYIANIYLGPDGTLWVGTTRGIYYQRRDGNFAEVTPPGQAMHFAQRVGTEFAALGVGEVVTVTRSGAFLLRRVQAPAGDSWTAEPMSLEGNVVRSVLAAPGGVLWYGCDEDLCKLAGGKTTRMSAALGLPTEKWNRMLLARDGRLWLRGPSHLGALTPGDARYEARDLPNSPESYLYTSLWEDPRGRIVASQEKDFGLWDGTKWRMVSTGGGPTHFDISTMFVDREGSVWMGVLAHGLRRWIETGNWEAYTDADGLSSDIVWATLRDRKGRLWIGTEAGLDWIPPGETRPRSWPIAGMKATRVYCLAESGDGSIWVGIAGANLIRIDPRTGNSQLLKTPEIYQLLMGDDQRLWVGTGEGLYTVDTRAKRPSARLVVDAGIPDPRKRFSSLSMDAEHSLWVASDEGIFRLNASGWRRLDALPSGLVPNEIAADTRGNLWVGGTFQGLFRLKFEGDRLVESAQISRPLLLSDQIVTLFVDHRGWLWVGQDAGVTVFDGQSWRSFTQEDGLAWNDTNSKALAEDTDGSMWIGTTGGLSHLVAPQANARGTPSAPAFSEVNFGAVPLVNGAKISWSPSPLDVSIGSLSFRDDRHFRLRYRLLGLEKNWEETTEKSLRYPRLDPGAYRLQAVAVDSSSGTASDLREFSFVIEPRWWQSWELKLGVSLLAALAAVLVWRRRVLVLILQKRQLEQAVRERTEALEREKAELFRTREQMRHDAEHDGLTELWNRRVILERLRHEVDRSQREQSPVTIMLVDLDHFKQVNDTFGHKAGDRVLKAIGALFQSLVRSYDWVGRYGGEEFLLVLPGSGQESAQVRAEEFRRAIESAIIQMGETAIPVTASFGVASGLTSDFETLIQAADTALYRAKRNGRNCVIAVEVVATEGAANTLGAPGSRK